MKVTRCIGIEPAENGWVVVESIFYEEDHTPAETVEHNTYDPSEAYGRAMEDARACLRKEEKVHVFSNHERLMAFGSEKTRTSS